MKLFAIIRFVVCILTGLIISMPLPVFGQLRIKAQDLTIAPEKYYNQTVVMEGFVREIQHTEGLFMGYYILECHLGGKVNVYTKNLPAPGSNYKVTAVVLPGKEPKSFKLEEVNRKRPGSLASMIILTTMTATIGMMLVLSNKGTQQGRLPPSSR